ncbi:receptor-type tyrosine-protein phosphatase H-like isoform X1 [Takifugu flavidus]|uniref:receptor-type tyrosine-protein phosphatase H-like isoform X1 n=2 Tax=Takifugu flavidus TaxID=433684 RepID=UPI00254461A2|nr:receptor-type tyrosine-protein phosphatase H-like isoform X1 [Takifugu flavidus]
MFGLEQIQMKLLCFETRSNCLMLLVLIMLKWDFSDCSSETSPTAVSPTTQLTTYLTTKLSLENVKNVQVSAADVSITLMWEKVQNISTYIVRYFHNSSKEVNVNCTEGASITHEISGLTPGTKYNFTIITVREESKSTGYTVKAVTRPLNPEELKAVTQNETSITLQWRKVSNIYSYILVYNETNVTVSASDEEKVIKEIDGLTSATRYSFRLFAVFENVMSSGISFSAATAPPNVEDVQLINQTETSITLQWRKVNNIYSYILFYNETNVTVSASDEEKVIKEIDGLTSATRYSFRLFAVFENVTSSGISFSAATAPPNVEDFQRINQNETSITLQWRKVNNLCSYLLVYNETNVTVSASDEEKVITDINGLTSATRYSFRLFTVFENVTSSGISLSAATAPRNSNWFKSISQNESSITLQWEKVDGILDYRLVFSREQINVSANVSQEQVTHVVSGLTNGTKYSFSVFAVFENIQSSGTELTAATVPLTLAAVRVTERTVSSVTLEWNVDVGKKWIYILHFNGKNITLNTTTNNVLSSTLSSLQPGTEYTFSVVTKFFELHSKAYEGFTVTAIDCSAVNWHVTDSSIQGEVGGLFSNATAANKSETHVSPGGSNVSFTGLYPGATYRITLMYEKNSYFFHQCTHNLTIIPPVLSGHCEHWGGGYSVQIVWNKPPGVWTAVEVNVSGRTLRTGEQYVTVSGFQPATAYQVSLAALSGAVRRPEPFVFLCHTDPRGVIAGSVIAVLIIGVLLCIAAFVYYKRPDIISRRKFYSGAAEQLNTKPKAISAVKFAAHFHRLSENEYMGFSEEYENLSPVGRDQTQKVALLPENKSKNRFVNILPYDWCRVKLSKSSPTASDYINASYMPGYNSKREYIATQGPLSSTLNDFWQMVWEQRVNGIVMVTNCTEKGRAKCEEYWPPFSKPCLYGELLVTTTSEQEESNWTLREFTVKHRDTCEECRVKHFHFTVWPDHGVPLNTEILIQFRGLVRQHIERQASSAPTVVHCSAGVGRTGTIIALDVLLQQLQNQKAVGINDFVHRMRLHRTNMVQTESQYIFLHQCIMDCLPSDKKTEESMYANADIIYVNATALKELHSNA